MTRSLQRMIFSGAGAAMALGTAGAEAQVDRKEQPLPAFPHPAITEVLYDVPGRELGGDANLDALRHAVGDEFVELMNPHTEPINLAGYTIRDGQPQEQFQLTFTFPDFMLGPGEVVVVFNGAGSDEIPGDDGSPEMAPGIKNPHFGNGWVFSMRQRAAHKAFANTGDLITLSAPDGTIVETIFWGDTPQAPPSAPRTAEVPVDPKMSLQRLTPTGPLMKHADINGERFSPGRIPETRADAREDGEDGARGE